MGVKGKKGIGPYKGGIFWENRKLVQVGSGQHLEGFKGLNQVHQTVPKSQKSEIM